MHFCLSEVMGMEVFSGRVHAEKLCIWGMGYFCSQPSLLLSTFGVTLGSDGALKEENWGMFCIVCMHELFLFYYIFFLPAVR